MTHEAAGMISPLPGAPATPPPPASHFQVDPRRNLAELERGQPPLAPGGGWPVARGGQRERDAVSAGGGRPTPPQRGPPGWRRTRGCPSAGPARAGRRRAQPRQASRTRCTAAAGSRPPGPATAARGRTRLGAGFITVRFGAQTWRASESGRKGSGTGRWGERACFPAAAGWRGCALLMMVPSLSTVMKMSAMSGRMNVRGHCSTQMCPEIVSAAASAVTPGEPSSRPADVSAPPGAAARASSAAAETPSETCWGRPAAMSPSRHVVWGQDGPGKATSAPFGLPWGLSNSASSTFSLPPRGPVTPAA